MKKQALIAIGALAAITITTTVCISLDRNSVKGQYQNPFTDVEATDWFSEDVRFVNEHNLMNGTSDSAFSPNETTTRGMIVTILWRLDGEPGSDSKEIFSDVDMDKYYADAVTWAFDNKIVNGYSNEIFGPEDDMTRQQLAAVLYRYAEFKGYDITVKSDLSSYKDAGQISEYAVDAFKWANENGIITGTSSDILDPQGKAHRSQIAAILQRFCTRFTTSEDVDKTAEKESAGSAGVNTNKSPISSGGGQRNATGGGTSGNAVSDAKKGYPQISIDKINANPGDTVQLLAKIHDNPGILGMTLTVNYDERSLMLESVENGEIFTDILDMTTSKTLASGAKLVWDGIEVKSEDIKDGSFLVMNFRISDNAEPGEYPITLDYSPGDVVDNDLTNVELIIDTGFITINN